MNKLFTGVVLIVLSPLIGFGQEYKAILFSGSAVYQSTYENRFSSNYRGGLGFNVVLGYEKNTSNSNSRFLIEYIQASQGRSLSTYSINFQPSLKYQYQRKVNSITGLRLGSYLDASTIISGRIGQWSTNNGISYSQWASVGLSSNYQKQSGSKILDISLSFPLLGYITRPSYGSTYPDEFLIQENFNIAEEGVAGAGVKSGKFKSINNFGNFDFRTTLFLPLKNSRWHFGIQYYLKILYISDLKPFNQFNNGVGITLKRK